ncbi:MAG: hypothetical protein Q8K26_03095, partial [Candidatus Gracilibacteria bacterium]|nr:hypothetical protein [Candidatus Gracilibacteria bacterium]
MNILDIKKKIFQKSFREFKDFFEEKKKAICDEKLKIESIRRGKVFEVYSALRLIGNDVWYNIAEYWTGLEGYDEKGIDFIYLEDSTLTILNCKSGKQNYSVKDIEEIFKGLQCIFEGGETKNTTLTKFIKKIELSKLKDINLYYCCELGDRESAKKNILLQNGIKLIQSYKKPREFSSVFNSINVKLKNFEDIYSIDELITLNIPYDE